MLCDLLNTWLSINSITILYHLFSTHNLYILLTPIKSKIHQRKFCHRCETIKSFPEWPQEVLIASLYKEAEIQHSSCTLWVLLIFPIRILCDPVWKWWVSWNFIAKGREISGRIGHNLHFSWTYQWDEGKGQFVQL